MPHITYRTRVDGRTEELTYGEGHLWRSGTAREGERTAPAAAQWHDVIVLDVPAGARDAHRAIYVVTDTRAGADGIARPYYVAGHRPGELYLHPMDAPRRDDVPQQGWILAPSRAYHLEIVGP